MTELPSPIESPLSIHGEALHAMAYGEPAVAAHCSVRLAHALRERQRLTTRMLQALDAYWLHCDGLPPRRYPRGRYDAETWWTRFERYRCELTEALRV